MRNKITFILLSGNGSRIRQFSSSKWALAFGLLTVILTVAGVGLLVQDYLKLKNTAALTVDLQTAIASRDAEIDHHQKQIECFANEINGLKNKLLALNDFEKKIRVIANLEKPAEEGNVFGVGGPIPEDLNPAAQLKLDQNQLLRDMHNQVAELEVASMVQSDGFASLLDKLKEQKNLLACTPSIRPVDGWVSSRFGYRVSPFTGRREFHGALDIANRQGTPIVSPANGVVTYADKKRLLGNYVVIDHGYGLVTGYGHLAKLNVKRGEKVRRGDVIAQMGSTGRSTGPHVHYIVKLNGVPVNPERYIID
ncbi:MAG: M23 family metallopeptidase [Desulfosarcina sp.]|nr:M23 family metallopeptidase [Desulfobacterales bacterium]